MKTFRIFAILLLACITSASAANVTFNLSDILQTAQPLQRKTVVIVPQSTPRTNATNVIVISEPRYFNIGTNASFVATNLVYGNYLVSVWGLNATSNFRILVPQTNGALYASDLLVTSNSVPGESAGYTQSAANNRFVLRNSGWASNLIVTNLTIPVGATAGYVLTSDANGKGSWAVGGSGGIATNAQPPSDVLTNLSATGLKSYATNIATLPTIYTNVIYVNATGAVSIAAVVSNAPARSTVVVSPGYYNTGNLGIGKDMVELHLMDGAVLTHTDSTGGEWMIRDFDNPMTFTVSGLGKFIVTNSTGIGGVYVENTASKFNIHCRLIWVQGSGFAVMAQSGSLSYHATDYTRSDTYDAFITGSPGFASPQKANYYSRQIFSGESIWEHNTAGTNWGDHTITCEHAEALPTANSSVHSIQLHDRGLFQAKTIFLNRTNAAIGSATTNEITVGGIVRGATITARSDSRRGIVEPEFQYGTAVTFEDCTIYGPTSRDPFLLYSFSPHLTLKNCTIHPGSSATNWARPSGASATVILSSPLNLGTPKLQASGVTVRGGTNVMHGIINTGNMTNSGSLRVGAESTFDGAAVFNSSGAFNSTITGTDATFDTLGVNNTILLPQAGTVSGFSGEIVFDADRFAAGRGGYLGFDGTSELLLVGALSSDTPANGEVPKYNSASGTVTWEADNNSGGGSGGTNFPPVINQRGSTNLAVNGGVRQAVTLTTNASFAFNLSGTPPNGATFIVGVSNFSASQIFMTTYVANALSSAFLPANASNVSVFAIPPTSIRWLEFLSETNFNLGTARWNIIRDQGKEMELTAGYGQSLATNTAGTYITNVLDASLRNLVASGSHSNFVVSSHGLINVTNGVNIGAATRYQIKADSGLFYIYDTVSGEAPFAIDDDNQLVTMTDGLSVQGSVSATATNFANQVKLTGGQAASSILRLDSGTNIVPATIGSGLSFDGTTLTSSGGATTFNSGAMLMLPNQGQSDFATAAQALVSSNTVYVMKVYVPANMVFSNICWRLDTGVASGQIGFGLYALDGTRILDTGPISCGVADTGYKFNSFTSATVTNGWYYYAHSGNNVTIAPRGFQAATTANTQISNAGGQIVYGTAANASVAGQLPSTLGTISAIGAAQYISYLVVLKGGL